ncbi:hypothetical protein Tco_1085146, partial [Tanacetum coccineum]
MRCFMPKKILNFEDFDSGTYSDNEGVRKKAIRQLGKMNKAIVDDGRSNTNWPSEASGSAKSKKGTKDSGNLKSKKGLKDSNGCHWVLQCSKLENEETWKGKTFDDIHKCL